MEKIAKQVLWIVLSISALWLLGLGLAAASVVFFIKAALIALVPVVGQAYAYLLCGLLCAVPLLVAFFLMQSTESVYNKADRKHAFSADSLGQLIRKHPLEAVTIAFTLGFSMDDADELKQVLRDAGHQVIKF